MMSRRVLTAAIVTVLPGLGPGAAAGQVFEPFAESPDVRVPVELMDRAGAGFPALVELSSARTTGQFPVLVIPALFADSPEPTVASDAIATTFFATEGQTLTTFYQEMSGGQLTVQGAVSDWVRTPYTVSQAAGNVDGHGWIGDLAGEHFAAAVAAVDSAVDFRLYDSDGPDGMPDSGDDDGYVDAVAFQFAEVSGSCGGPGFWPHRSSLRDSQGNWGLPTADTAHDGEPIRVLGYTTQSVVECDGVTPHGPNVLAHEFGHILGLPDFYRAVEGIEATQRHWMVGCFGLMAAGSWGCGTDTRVQGFGPSGLSPLSRDILGWSDAIVVGSIRDTTYVLDPIQSGGRFLEIPLTADSSEVLLVEYRPRLSFDEVLPAGGVLVYHVDRDADIFGGAYAETFPYWIVEADGTAGLRRTLPDGGDRGVPEDVFARAGAVDSLTPATVPNTHATSGEPSGVWIRSISIASGQARIRLSTVTTLSADSVSVPAVARALEPMELRLRIRGGTQPYEAIAPPDGMAVAGLSIRMAGDTVVVDGTPLLGGRNVAIPLHVRDATGEEWYGSPIVELQDASLTDEELMAPLASPSAADEDVRTYLDLSGNADGVYDVGDLRAYLRRGGGS